MHDYSIGVVGSERMGASLAALAVLAKRQVTLVDITAERARRGIETARSIFVAAAQRGRITVDQVDEFAARIVPSGAVEDLRGAGIVIEAVREDLERKRNLLTRLDGIIEPATILATATSRFRVADLASGTRHPERVLGLHYLHPLDRNRLIEVVADRSADSERVTRLWRLAQSEDRIPIRSADQLGFVVNRLVIPFWVEAAAMLEERFASIATIEAAACELLDSRRGPFAQMNLVTLPTVLELSESLSAHFGVRWKLPDSARQYRDAELEWPLSATVPAHDNQAVIDRLAGVLLLAAGEILDEEITKPSSLARATDVGLRWTRGPMEIPSFLGEDRARDAVTQAAAAGGVEVPAWWQEKRRLHLIFRRPWVTRQGTAKAVILTMDRAESENELDETLCATLQERLSFEAEHGEHKRIVLASAIRPFLRGPSVKRLQHILREEGDDAFRACWLRLKELADSIAEHPKEIVAAVEGEVSGAGGEILAACHRVVVAPGATTQFDLLRAGLLPFADGAFRLSQRVLPPVARHLLFTGTQLGLDGAEELWAAFVADTIASPGRAIRKAATMSINSQTLPPDAPRIRRWKSVWTDGWTPALVAGKVPSDLPEKLLLAAEEARDEVSMVPPHIRTRVLAMMGPGAPQLTAEAALDWFLGDLDARASFLGYPAEPH